MTEILTESFCERCGTRYTFETARPQNSRISRAKTLTKGLRNYVLSDDSFSEAMADARGEEELAATVVQLDAFHKTFNFCLSCRQYTCGNCWNVEEGRCLSCAPLPGSEQVEDLEPGASEAIAGRLAAIAAPPAGIEDDLQSIGIAAWPAVDLPSAEPEAPAEAPEAPAALGAPAPTLEAPAAAEPAAGALAAPAEAEPAAPAGAAAAGSTPAVAQPAAEPAEAPHPALQGLKPGESLEDAIAAYEAAHADVAAAPVGEPEQAPVEAAGSALAAATAAVAPEAPLEAPAPGAIPAEPEPAPAAAVVEAAPAAPASAAPAPPETEAAAEPPAPLAPPTPRVVEPVAPPAAPERVAATAAQAEPAPAGPAPEPAHPEPVAATAAQAEPVAPAAPDTFAPGWLTVAPDDGSAPAWPERRRWPTPTRKVDSATLAGRKLLPSSNAAAMWAASAREVVEAGPLGGPGSPSSQETAATAQPCVGCGLSLSANARFCRRCGARQG